MIEEFTKNDIRIKDVIFLTPARIIALVNGKEENIMASVDLANRKVYSTNGDSSLSNYVFDYLDAVNILPENFFSAPEEVMQEAANADMTRQQIFNEATGGMNE